MAFRSDQQEVQQKVRDWNLNPLGLSHVVERAKYQVPQKTLKKAHCDTQACGVLHTALTESVQLLQQRL